MRMLTIIILLALALPLWAGEYEEAVKLIKAKKYGVAKTLLEAVAKKDGSPKVLYALGFCHEKTDDKVKAVQCYRDAVAENLNEGTDGDDAGRALKKLMGLKPDIGPVLTAAQDLEAQADEKQSEFMRQAARKLYDHALDPANWNLKEPEKPEPLINVGVLKKIPEGAAEYEGHRYHVFETTPGMTWAQAQEACEKVGGYLLCINDQKEQEWLKKGIVLDVRVAYVGMLVKGGRLRWVDGKAVRYSAAWVGGKPEKPEKDAKGIIYGKKWGSNIAQWRTGKESSIPPHVTHYICEWED